MNIPQNEWKWYGTAAHFIGSFGCHFHLATKVGNYIISTVGEYIPSEEMWDFEASRKGIELKGRGDEKRYDYLNRVGYSEIGFGRTFETMVFECSGECQCGCGLPNITGSECDFSGYTTAKDASEGHYAHCLKWSEVAIERRADNQPSI